MNETENPLISLSIVAVIVVAAIAWIGIDFSRQLHAFTARCHATGGQVIHPRGEVLCIRGGLITGWMHG